MASVTVDGTQLIVEIAGVDKILALKRKLTIDLAHVRGATFDPGAVREPKGIRAPGAHVPGVIVAGTFRRDGERTFWDVHNGDKAVVIELVDDEYDRIIVEVDDPRGVVQAVNAAIQ
jgi:hypothetical protein